MYVQLVLNSHGKTFKIKAYAFTKQNELLSYSATQDFKDKYACSYKICKYTLPLLHFVPYDPCNQTLHKERNINITKCMT